MTSEIVPNKFLASTKAFFDHEKKEISYNSFLKRKNLLDYGQLDGDFHYIYDPDLRMINYIKASLPELPYPFVLSGHGNITRDSCAEFHGLKATKSDVIGTMEPMFKSCNQLPCPKCVLKACSKKAHAIVQKYRDYIWYLIMAGFSGYELRPIHYALNPNFVDKHGVEHINFIPDFSSSKNYRKSLMDFAKVYIEPYMDASTWCYHEHRFANEEKTELRSSGHFHVVGWGFFPHFKEFEAKHGFQYVNINYKNGTAIESLADIFRIWRYELSHVVFPINKIIRTTKRTETEISDMARENMNRQLLGIESIQITEYKQDWSYHSQPAYFYQGFMSPYLTRKIKERKIKLPERSDVNNEKMYPILDGFILRIMSLSGWKVYRPNEAIDKRIKIDLSLQIKIYKSRLKFSNRACREKHFLRTVKIKKFNLIPGEQKK